MRRGGGTSPALPAAQLGQQAQHLVRALAGGFEKAAAAVLLAYLIRGMFHDRKGGFRVDGWAKAGWVADAFAISVRSVRSGHARLVGLGIVRPLDAPQWALNRRGTHYALAADWAPQRPAERLTGATGEGEAARGGFAPPGRQNPGSLAPPDLTESPSSKDSKPEAPDGRPAQTPATVASQPKVQREPSQPGGDRPPSVLTKPARRTEAARTGPPMLRDVRLSDLADDRALTELHRQAVEAGQWGDSEAERLDFFSLAERSRCHGQRPGALFAWLVRRGKREFIALADEDRAAERLRTMRSGPATRTPRPEAGRLHQGGGEIDDDARFAEVCGRVAQQTRMDPFRVARMKRPDLTRDEWERMELHAIQARRQPQATASAEQGGLAMLDVLKGLLQG